MQVVGDRAALLLLRRDQTAHKRTLPRQQQMIVDRHRSALAQRLHRRLVLIGEGAATDFIG